MRPRIHAAIIGTIALVVPLTARAQDSVFVLGFGNRSCREFLQAADKERKATPPNPDPQIINYSHSYAVYISFAMGFLSGAKWRAQMSDKDRTVKSSTDKDHFASAQAWLQNCCRQKPLDDFYDAVTSAKP